MLLLRGSGKPENGHYIHGRCIYDVVPLLLHHRRSLHVHEESQGREKVSSDEISRKFEVLKTACGGCGYDGCGHASAANDSDANDSDANDSAASAGCGHASASDGGPGSTCGCANGSAANDSAGSTCGCANGRQGVPTAVSVTNDALAAYDVTVPMPMLAAMTPTAPAGALV